ncbi:MAG: hypothetical protein F6K28_13850 [Microcoleus sp. SIO2G3]|nr:hypothetical protein [Microcoleus sp. SIO2G3]
MKSNYQIRTANKILIAAKNSPDFNLLLETKVTEDLIEEFLRQNLINHTVGELLKARFIGGGNIVLEYKIKGTISNEAYIVIVSLVNYFESLFNLIQTFWEYIKPELKTNIPSKRYPKTDVELFTTILKEEFNNRFRERMLGCNYSKKNVEKHAQLEVEYMRTGLQLPNKEKFFDGDVNKKQELESIAQKQKSLSSKWTTFVLETLIQYVKTDEILERMLRQHLDNYIYMKESLVKILRHDRKHEQQFKGIRFVNGIRVS